MFIKSLSFPYEETRAERVAVVLVVLVLHAQVCNLGHVFRRPFFRFFLRGDSVWLWAPTSSADERTARTWCWSC